MKTRIKGNGTLYQRAQDGMWCVSIPLPSEGGKRRRRVVVRKYREDAEAVLAGWRDELDLAPVMSRAELMAEARSRGTHTKEELRALLIATTTCRYCKTGLELFNRVQDHIVPVARGGSDAIDNIQFICWECNIEKRDKLDYEYTGDGPRPLRPLPIRQGWWN